MAGQRTVYPLRIIRRDYSYTTQEVAEMFRTCEHTVLRWVKAGLKTIPGTRPYLIHSSDLLAFLEVRQARRKHPCGPTQFFCCRCRGAREITPASLDSQPTRNRMMRLTGLCEVCGGKVNKVVRPTAWGPEHPLYPRINASVQQHSGTQPAQPECSVEEGEQLCLNLTR